MWHCPFKCEQTAWFLAVAWPVLLVNLNLDCMSIGSSHCIERKIRYSHTVHMCKKKNLAFWIPIPEEKVPNPVMKFTMLKGTVAWDVRSYSFTTPLPKKKVWIWPRFCRVIHKNLFSFQVSKPRKWTLAAFCNPKNEHFPSNKTGLWENGANLPTILPRYLLKLENQKPRKFVT